MTHPIHFDALFDAWSVQFTVVIQLLVQVCSQIEMLVQILFIHFYLR